MKCNAHNTALNQKHNTSRKVQQISFKYLNLETISIFHTGFAPRMEMIFVGLTGISIARSALLAFNDLLSRFQVQSED